MLGAHVGVPLPEVPTLADLGASAVFELVVWLGKTTLGIVSEVTSMALIRDVHQKL